MALLDTADLQCKVEQAAADLAQAEAVLAALVAGSRPEEIRVSEATLASARAETMRQLADFKRAEELRGTNALSAEEFDRRKSLYEVAVARQEEAKQRLALTREGPRKEDIDAGRARVGQAQAALQLARTNLGYATLRAPMPGVVLSKNIEPGEYVSPGTPVVTVGNLKDIWLRGYINETDLGRVKWKQPARVTTDTYPGKVYEGHVSFISQEAEFTPKSVETQQQRVKLVYRVKIKIKNPEMELKPGMPAEADILLDAPPIEEKPTQATP